MESQDTHSSLQKHRVSIILPLYDCTNNLRKFTLNAIKCIREHTNPALYELIIVDNKVRGKQPTATLATLDYHGSKELQVDEEHCTIIKNDPDIGYYASMNQGAKVATGDYLLFTQNDILVLPHWLDDLLYYLDHNLTDAIFPDMMPHGWEWRKQHDALSYEENLWEGCIESGMMMVRQECFWKVGGWYEELWQEIGWKVMLYSFGEKKIRYHSTTKVPIIHINQASRDALEEQEPEKFKEIMHNDFTKANEWEHHFRKRSKIECPQFCAVCHPPT